MLVLLFHMSLVLPVHGENTIFQKGGVCSLVAICLYFYYVFPRQFSVAVTIILTVPSFTLLKISVYIVRPAMARV